MLSFKTRFALIVFLAFSLPVFSQLNLQVYMDEARKELNEKNYFDAIQKLDVCIEVNPNEYVAYFYRGVCKYYLKDNLGAELDLNSSMSAYNPLLYDAYHYRSLVKYRLGDYEGAVKDIDHVIEGTANDPDPELYVERAFFKLSGQDFKGSLSDCNTALHNHYAGENVYLCRGMAENALAHYDSALLNYAIAVKLNPKDIDAYLRTGITDYTLEKYTDAIVQYNKALKIDSTSTLAYFNRSEAYIKLDSNQQAMDDLNTVIMYDPMNALAFFNRAILEANKNNYTDAIADFDKVLTINPKNIQALFNRAKLKSEIKDYHGALADYNSVIDLFPYYVEAYYERGKVKEALKDYNGAKSDYRMGNMAARISHLSDTLQRAHDSAALTRLMALNSNFSNENQKLSDTTRIDLLPLYRLTVKTANHENENCIPVLMKKFHKEYTHFCLTNKENGAGGTPKENASLILNETNQSGDALLQKAVSETNMQLFSAATNDYTKLITDDTASAINYFARGINICRKTEILGQLNNDQQYSYVNKTYKVATNPANAGYEKAIADFNKAIQLEPDFIYALYDRAYAKYKIQDFEGAIQDYNQALQIDPGFADAYYNRGLLLFLQNDKIDACEDFSKAGELGLTQAYIIIKAYCTEVTK